MASRLRILGCSGGIGKGLRTTSFLFDDDTLIDAGTGVGDLTVNQLRKVDRIFLTHSHLDHISSIGFIPDAVGASRSRPLTVYGLPETLEAVERHIFNDIIWPDFTKIPTRENPFVVLRPIQIGKPVRIGARSVTALPVSHSVPAVGYALDSGEGKLVYTGDMGPSDELWKAIRALGPLHHLIIEASFENADRRLADLSGHLCPDTLVAELRKFEHREVEIWTMHQKPGTNAEIRSELERLGNRLKCAIPRDLIRDTTLVF